MWEKSVSTLAWVSPSSDLPFGMTYRMNSWFLSHAALSVERYGLAKNALTPHSSISWNLANSGPLSLRLHSKMPA